MNVKMWNALADAVVHRYEGAVGLERSLDRTADELGILEKRAHQFVGQVSQSFIMRLRN